MELDEEAMVLCFFPARNGFFGLDDGDLDVFLVGEMRPRDSNVLCSPVPSWCCATMVSGGPWKLGMLPRAGRVIAKTCADARKTWVKTR